MSVGWSVIGWFDGWVVCHYFLKGQEVTLPCFITALVCTVNADFKYVSCYDRKERLDEAKKAFR